MTDNDLITVLTTSAVQEERGGLPNFKGFGKSEIKIGTETLSKNLKDFLEKIKPIIESQTTDIGQFSVTEIELNLAINASGGIDLIGKFDAGIEGGITIKFTRKENK